MKYYEYIIKTMSIIAPPQVGTNREVKVSTGQAKNFLKDSLLACTREIMATEDGRKITVAQGIAHRLTNIALYAESNTDSIAASKLIFERLYGKAAVEKVEEQKEMPKVIFALNDTGLEKLNEAAKKTLPKEEDTDSAQILVETDDGKEFLA